MRINKGQLIGAIAAIDARRFMLRHKSLHFGPEALREMFPELSVEEEQQTWRPQLRKSMPKLKNA